MAWQENKEVSTLVLWFLPHLFLVSSTGAGSTVGHAGNSVVWAYILHYNYKLPSLRKSQRRTQCRKHHQCMDAFPTYQGVTFTI